MKKFAAILWLPLLFGTACSEKHDINTTPSPGSDKIQVILPISESIGEDAGTHSQDNIPITRTLILGDGNLNKAGWAETDKVLLWAIEEGSTDYLLRGETFSYYVPLHGNALFTATIPEMAPGTYNYYGSYPVSNAIDGTRVTYTLPAQQSGVYDGSLDIMLARPATGSELTAETPASAAQLAFAHKCHMLRIQVPMGRNKWGVGIKKLRIKFPAEVVGDLQFDVTNPDAEPVFTNGSSTVTLNLIRPLDESEEDASEGNYVWVFVRPGVQLDGNLEFTAYTAEGYQSETISTPISKTLVEGRITPVTMSIPKELPVTYIDFSIIANNLGEDIQKLHITTPEGATLRNGSNTQIQTVTNGKSTMSFYNTVDGRNNGDIIRTGLTAIGIESENARINQTRAIDNFIPGDHIESQLTIPYLFYEDFSGVNTFHKNDNNTTGRTSAGSSSSESLGNLENWVGARCGAEEGKALRICCRGEQAVWVAASYNGRADSPNMSNLKEGKNVKLRVQFNYSHNRQSSKNSANPHYMTFGTHTTAGSIDAKGALGSLGSDIADSNAVGRDLAGTNDGSFDNIYKQADYTISNCTNANRFVWEVYINSKCPDGYYNNWVYIDNIRISIVK